MLEAELVFEKNEQRDIPLGTDTSENNTVLAEHLQTNRSVF